MEVVCIENKQVKNSSRNLQNNNKKGRMLRQWKSSFHKQLDLSLLLFSFQVQNAGQTPPEQQTLKLNKTFLLNTCRKKRDPHLSSPKGFKPSTPKERVTQSRHCPPSRDSGYQLSFAQRLRLSSGTQHGCYHSQMETYAKLSEP